jgi:arginyl-tRNA synthetase
MIQATRELLHALGEAIADVDPASTLSPTFESPKQAAHGDLACTAAMQLARSLKKSPRDVAQSLIDALRRRPATTRWVDGIDIAGPGFINLRLKTSAKQAVVAEVLQLGERFGWQPPNDRHMMVEFVSANPTGPLHVGHGRQAALGDAICRLYETQGWQVTREFYYNDAGVQIATLAISTQARIKGLKPGDLG